MERPFFQFKRSCARCIPFKDMQDSDREPFGAIILDWNGHLFSNENCTGMEDVFKSTEDHSFQRCAAIFERTCIK